ncbi:class I SAM-dependent methyltransferase [Desnuesiella massiliensis]|uniref:class I SAM-dependent methyltransferase n=1 Tax=Desnuesiella massiliensis TaxID=1650662 RepID=UPI0006E139E8|nr:class I SAM-dependent methyltransferase [Desnuesiella massiliensis]
MNFYNVLSKYYDVIFTKDENTVNFLKEDLQINSNVLDVACGTGTYSIALGEQGNKVQGMDLDEEMINKAIVKNHNNNASFIVGDMLKLENIYEAHSFHKVFCIGNSLVHLKTKEEIEKAIEQMYKVLKKEGTLVIQIINYDRILNKNIKALPTILREEEGVEFVRKYELNGEGKIVFLGQINIEEDGNSYENGVELIPLQSEEINQMLLKIGFKNIKFYGSFKKEVYNKEESYALVLRAEK